MKRGSPLVAGLASSHLSQALLALDSFITDAQG